MWKWWGKPPRRTSYYPGTGDHQELIAEGETSKPSEKYTGGKGTAGQGIYLGPCTPPNTTYHHYTFVMVATDLDPKALPAGLTHPELLAKLDGHVKGSAGLVGLFKKP